MNPLAPLYRLADGCVTASTVTSGGTARTWRTGTCGRSGFTVVARNWRPPQGGGEIDIIAWEGDWLVFVEVKTRSSASGARPSGISTREKMQYVRRAARDYMRRVERGRVASAVRRYLDYRPQDRASARRFRSGMIRARRMRWL